jgi:hypothetical protein
VEVSGQSNSITISRPFSAVRDALEKMSEVDGVTAGVSPVTVRWLLPRNVFVNVGLEEVTKDSCRLLVNNNSYNVTPQDLEQVHTGLLSNLERLEKSSPATKTGAAPKG